MNVVISSAPAKLIISGEYSILYGHSAIVTCIPEMQTKVEIKKTHDMRVHLNLKDLGVISSSMLRDLNSSVSEKPFRNSEDQKILWIIKKFLSEYRVSYDNSGMYVEISSDIPIGGGFGSSAALVVSLLKALHKFFNIEIREIEFLRLAKDIEGLYHGKSSGLDILASYFEKSMFCVQERGELKYEFISIKRSIFEYLYTGKPDSSTSDCVAYVMQRFPSEHSIWNKISKVTVDLKHSLEFGNIRVVRDLIRKKHEYLVRIGVVPEEVQKLIENIEKQGRSAKVCGAGSISGKSAGAVLVV